MKYLIIFNLFCLAAFLQMASRAPLVDDNEHPLEPIDGSRWSTLRQLFELATIK